MTKTIMTDHPAEKINVLIDVEFIARQMSEDEDRLQRVHQQATEEIA